jgi:hypothetical protein
VRNRARAIVLTSGFLFYSHCIKKGADELSRILYSMIKILVELY